MKKGKERISTFLTSQILKLISMCYSDDLGLLSKYLLHSLSSQEAKTYTAQSICKLLTSAKTFSCCYSKARLAQSDAKHILFIWFLFTVYYIFAHILGFSPLLLKPGASQYFLSNLRDRFSLFFFLNAQRCGRCAHFTRPRDTELKEFNTGSMAISSHHASSSAVICLCKVFLNRPNLFKNIKYSRFSEGPTNITFIKLTSLKVKNRRAWCGWLHELNMFYFADLLNDWPFLTTFIVNLIIKSDVKSEGKCKASA